MLILGAACVLLLRLDGSYLWQDEAETAVLARNVLRYGYPRAFDGVHLLHVPFAAHRPGYVWVFHQWLQFYLAAASFAIFGMTTSAARLPFAVLGIASLVVAWRLTRALFDDPRIAAVSTALLSLSVPFLLHMRQCRYYAPMTLWTLCAILAYWRWLAGRRHAAWWWLTSMLLLFHSNWMASAALLAGLGGHWLFAGGRASLPWRRAWPWVSAFGLLCAPWLLYARVWEHSAPGLTFTEVRHNLEFYVKMVNGYVVPLLGLAAAALWLRRSRPATTPDHAALSLVGWVILATFAALLPARQHFFRYMIAIVPLLFLVAAWLLVRCLGHRPGILVAVLVLLIGTDALHRPDRLFSGEVRSYPLDYAAELLHGSPDSVKGIIDYLNTHAAPGETVKIRYAISPLVFYTRLRVDTNAMAFFDETYPDWIVFQQGLVPDSFYESPYFASIEARYERLDTQIPDYYWGSPPDPYLHLFRWPNDLPRVVIYHRKSGVR